MSLEIEDCGVTIISLQSLAVILRCTVHKNKGNRKNKLEMTRMITNGNGDQRGKKKRREKQTIIPDFFGRANPIRWKSHPRVDIYRAHGRMLQTYIGNYTQVLRCSRGEVTTPCLLTEVLGKLAICQIE